MKEDLETKCRKTEQILMQILEEMDEKCHYQILQATSSALKLFHTDVEKLVKSLEFIPNEDFYQATKEDLVKHMMNRERKVNDFIDWYSQVFRDSPHSMWEDSELISLFKRYKMATIMMQTFYDPEFEIATPNRFERTYV